MKVWVRLGGYITADSETITDILNGDEEALAKAIMENGFEVDGNTYEPKNEVEFELDSIKLKYSEE